MFEVLIMFVDLTVSCLCVVVLKQMQLLKALSLIFVVNNVFLYHDMMYFL